MVGIKNFMEKIFTKYEQEIFPKHAKIYMDSLQNSNIEKINFNELGSESEIYLKAIINHVLLIDTEIDKIKLIPILLALKEIPEIYTKNNINAIEYYRIKIEYFHIKIVSIIDYCANLINDAYQLGYPKRECNSHSLAKNENIKNSITCQKLKDFVKEFQNLNKDRNVIIHEGGFKNMTLENIDRVITIVRGDFVVFSGWFYRKSVNYKY
jgi:hypothetical protein